MFKVEDAYMFIRFAPCHVYDAIAINVIIRPTSIYKTKYVQVVPAAFTLNHSFQFFTIA
jgi:hypothetical protein